MLLLVCLLVLLLLVVHGCTQLVYEAQQPELGFVEIQDGDAAYQGGALVCYRRAEAGTG